MNPRRSAPERIKTSPAMTAIMPARATARVGSPPDSGNTVARISVANAESGPSTRIRLGPNSAYASSGMMVA